MPALSVLAIRLSLIYLVFGFSLGELMLSQKGLGWLPIAWVGLPAHIESLVFGWMAQLAIGVAFWILPRFGGQRGEVRLAWAALAGLNLGVITIIVSGPLSLPPWCLALGHGLEAAAALAFVGHAWPRVKPPGA